MKLYVIHKTWVNWDGWPISGPEVLKEPTFLDKKAAWAYCAEQSRLEERSASKAKHSYSAHEVEVNLPS
jgi:hypothetical protein